MALDRSLADEQRRPDLLRAQLAREPALADSRLAEQQDDPQLAGGGSAQLVFEPRELVAPANELRSRA
jgi:hypothetical protein